MENYENQLKNCFDVIEKYKEKEMRKSRIIPNTAIKKKEDKPDSTKNGRGGMVRSISYVRDLNLQQRRKGNEMLEVLEKGHNRGRGHGR